MPGGASLTSMRKTSPPLPSSLKVTLPLTLLPLLASISALATVLPLSPSSSLFSFLSVFVSAAGFFSLAIAGNANASANAKPTVVNRIVMSGLLCRSLAWLLTFDANDIREPRDIPQNLGHPLEQVYRRRPFLDDVNGNLLHPLPVTLGADHELAG